MQIVKITIDYGAHIYEAMNDGRWRKDGKFVFEETVPAAVVQRAKRVFETLNKEG